MKDWNKASDTKTYRSMLLVGMIEEDVALSQLKKC